MLSNNIFNIAYGDNKEENPIDKVLTVGKLPSIQVGNVGPTEPGIKLGAEKIDSKLYGISDVAKPRTLELPALPQASADLSSNQNNEPAATQEQAPVSTSPQGNPNLGAALNFNFPELNMPQVQNGVPLPDLSGVGTTISGALNTKPVEEAVVETGKATYDASKDIAEAIGDATHPVSAIIGTVTAPVKQAIDEAINSISNLGVPKSDILSGSTIRQGSGLGYGEVKLGGSGAVLDVSKQLDTAFSDVVSGTAMHGVSGSDVFQVATDPKQFIQNKGAEAATNTLTNALGMSRGAATDIVSAISDPNKFIQNKGTETIANEVAKSIPGGGAGAANAVSTLLSTGDVGKAAEAGAKAVASQAVVDTVSGIANAIIPGAGVVLQVLASIFHYSCYLSTASLYHGFIDKEQYFDFTRYQLRYRGKDRVSKIMWIGYIVGFEPLYEKMLMDRDFALKMFNWVISPWHQHIKYCLGIGEFNFNGWVVTQFLKVYTMGAYFIRYQESKKVQGLLSEKNVLGVYRKIIKVLS